MRVRIWYEERQRRMPVQRRRAQANAVPGRLRLDPAERRSLRLGLDDADGPSLDEKQIIGRPRAEGKLPHRHAQPCAQVEVAAVLHHPAVGFQQSVDILAGVLLGRRHS